MTHAMPPRQPEPTQWQQYTHQQPQWAAAPPPPAPPKKRKRWPWIVGAVLLLFVIIGVANSGSSEPQPGVPSGVDPSTYNPQPSAVPGGVTVQTVEAAPASGPHATFGSGTYEVGTGDGEVAPGKYKTAGPADGAPSCYWARLRNTDGDFDSIITNGNAQGPSVVTVGKNDGAFETTCTWQKAG